MMEQRVGACEQALAEQKQLLADALEKVAAVAALLHAQVADGADGGGGFGDNKGLSAFFAALEIKYQSNFGRIEKRLLENVAVTTSFTERSEVRLAAIEREMSSYMNYMGERASLQQQLKEVKKAFEEFKEMSALEQKNLTARVGQLANTMAKVKLTSDSLVNQEDLHRLIQKIDKKYASSMLMDHALENLKYQLVSLGQQKVSKVEFFEVYRRLEEFISSGGTSGANNALEAKFDAKMAMMATKESVDQVARDFEISKLAFQSMVQERSDHAEKRVDSLAERFEDTCRFRLARLEERVDLVSRQMEKATDSNRGGAKSLESGLVSLMSELQKSMKNRDSKEIEEIRTIISAEHKSYEERFIELFNLKADRRELTKLTDYLNGNFLTMEKGSDILYRLCQMEDLLTKTMSLGQSLLPRFDEMAHKMKYQEGLVEVERTRAEKEEARMERELRAQMLKVEQGFFAKADRDEVLKLLDTRRFVTVLSEVQAEHERVKEAVVKHIEVLEHLLYFQMSKKHKFGKILQVLDRIFYVTTIFKEADQNERLLQRSIFLKECGRIKRNLRSMEKQQQEVGDRQQKGIEERQLIANELAKRLIVVEDIHVDGTVEGRVERITSTIS